MYVAIGAIGGALIGAVGSSIAAGKQADAIENAAQLSSNATLAAQQLQKQMYDQTRADQTPWRTTGGAALNQLSYEMGLPTNQASTTPALSDSDLRAKFLPQYTKQATSGVFGNSGGVDEQGLQKAIDDYKAQNATTPFVGTGQAGALANNFSMADYQADPGYAFRLSEGIKALDRSASAKGQLLSGSALKGVTQYGQDMASQEYQNAFNRYQSNKTTNYNQLASLAGVGQTANNALQSANTNYANSSGNLTMTNAANQGNAAIATGNANASSYAGIGNALSQGANALGRYYSQPTNTGSGSSFNPYPSDYTSYNEYDSGGYM